VKKRYQQQRNLKAFVVAFFKLPFDPTKAALDENLNAGGVRAAGQHTGLGKPRARMKTSKEITSLTSLLLSFSSKLDAFCIVIVIASVPIPLQKT
jgi:hypothetical protein